MYPPIRSCAALPLVFLVGLVLSASTFAGQFTAIPVSIPGLRYAAVAWGDFDNDGRLDLLVCGDTGAGSITRIYRNMGAGGFVDIQAGLPGVSNGAVAWGDYNGDGFLDFALTGMTSTGRVTRIFRNNGNGTFTDINANLPGLESSRLVWGDYDNDGDLDLFVTGYDGSNYVARIYRNDGNDQFSDSGVTTISGGAGGAAAWADFDNDGDLDLLFAGFTGDTTYGQSSRLYRNNNSAFTNITSLSLTAMSSCSVAWEDYDNDGNLDLLMVGSSIAGVQSYPTVRLYRNNASGSSFTSISTSLPAAQNCSVAWGDFNNDGFPDIAIAGYNSSFAPFAAIYSTFASNIFADSGAGLTGVVDGALACGDFDNDGDLDLLVTGFDGTTNVTRLYRNDVLFANSIPNAPWNLYSTVSGKAATFHWYAGSDAEQSGGLTYNLRVGTTPGADNVMPSHANAATGFRRLPALGNANERLAWTLTLPVGTYYWSVQSIDHGFAGSHFATEQMLVIPPQAPDASTLTATNVNLDHATVRGVADPNGDATLVWFEYGTTTSYGSTNPAQSIGSGVSPVNVSALLTNLLPAVTYQYRLVASNSFGITYGTNQSFLTPLFSEVAGLTFLGAVSGSVAWGDYDNDGYLDLLIAGGNATGTVTRVYHNLGGTNFVEIPAGLPGINSNGGQAAWGDFDNDGRLDVLLTCNGASRIFHNEGGGVFTDLNAGLPSLYSAASAAWGDFNNDGNLDVALAGGGASTVKTYRNNGSGVFAELTNSLPALSDSSIAWADSDNNGTLDLLVTGYGSSETTRLYRYDGRGTFTNSNISFQNVSRGSVAWGDYNNDGFLDILLTGSASSGLNRYSMLYSNNGAGGFVSRSISTVTKMDQSCVAWGDYNNDGLLDFAATGMTSTGAVVKVYRNDGSVFHDSGAALPALGTNAKLAWGDFDNDGRLDLLVSGYDGTNYVAKLYRNNSLVANTPPTAPANLASTVVGNSATLSWGPAADVNQSGGLSYNVRLGTTPGGSDALSPMADAATGFRRVPQLGNAGLRLNYPLTNLLIGTYYWAVQAIDHNYAGSGFSTNGTFTITAALLPPLAITQGVTNIGLYTATLQGTANSKGATTTAWFQYGTTTNFGSTTAPQDIGRGRPDVSISAALSGLADGTVYYYRLAASNINGTVYGSTLAFTTGLLFSNIVTSFPTTPNVAWGDYNNDGRLDVAVCGSGLSGTYLYRNEGGGVFTLVNTNLPPGYGSLEWGDYDRDGYLDLLIANSPGLVVARNNGDGTFSVATNVTVGLFGTAFATWVDYDNDGDLDICCYDAVGSNSSAAQAHLYRNDNGVFVPSGVPMPQLVSGWMAWGDYDGDGLPDLAVTGQMVVTNYSRDLTRIYHNEGDGNFTDINAPLTGLENSRVVWGDFDNDGNLDLLCAGSDASGYRTLLYRNLGNGTFVDANAGLPGCEGLMGCADYDNDGNQDVLLQFIGNYYTTNRIYRNLGNGTFVDSGKYFWAANTPYMIIPWGSWADYDGDGNVDVLVGSQLWHNNGLLTNTPPSAPTGLSATRDGNVVTLTWDPPSDPNQTGGWTYNLQVGTTPGGYDVLAPESDPSGWRRVVKPGRASRPLWKLVLPVGTYYWKVQAIDAALVGSPFSAEASFGVPVQSPRVLTLPASTNSTPALVLNATVNPNGDPTTAYFQYGLTTNYNLQTPAQALGGSTAILNLSATLSNLAPEVTYHYRAVAANAFGLSYGVDHTFVLPYFLPVTAPNFSAGTTRLGAWGDYNNDGQLDFIFGAQLYRNLGQSVFTNVSTGILSAGGPVAWADVDNDGRLDLVLCGYYGYELSRTLLIYRNNGDGTFSNMSPGLLGVDGYGGLAWGDFDNDGRVDLLVTGGDSSGLPTIALYRNLGGGSFAPVPISIPPLTGGGVAWGDYDNDGYLDLLVSGQTSSNVICRVYHNNHDGTFTDIQAHLPPICGSVGWGDYNNDGWLDFFVSGVDTNNSPVTKVFRNDGGVFTDSGLQCSIGTSNGGGGAAWGDFNNDGRLDLIVGGYAIVAGQTANTYSLLYNNGDGTFSEGLARIQGLGPGGYYDVPFFGDWDNDGRLDLLLGDGRLLHNNVLKANLPPTAPAGLQATPAGNSVLLAWAAATDPDQVGGLTYNVRVGHAPGTGDVLSPLSGPSGQRYVAQLGNANCRTNFVLNNLSVGTYYWSVQAIDHTFVGSPFAAEGTFTIPLQAPQVSTGAASNVVTAGAALTGILNPNGVASVAWFEYGLTTSYGSRTLVQNFAPLITQTNLSADITNLSLYTTYQYRLVASNSFGLTYGANRSFATPLFTPVPIAYLTNNTGALVIGDFNGDGALDLLANDNSRSTTPLLLGNGQGGFTNVVLSISNLNLYAFSGSDYNKDNRPDFAAMNYSGGFYFFHVFRNDGTGRFASVDGFSCSYGPLDWGDYDNNGSQDLVASGATTDVYRHLGTNQLARAFSLNLGGCVSWGDYDGDGRLDLLLAGMDQNSAVFTKLFHNNGPAGFTDSGIALPAVFSQAMWVDYDGDGKPDLLLAGPTNNWYGAVGTPHLLHNLGNGQFAEVPTSLPGMGNLVAAWGDYDNDGLPDLLMQGNLGGRFTVRLFHNDGNGSFTDMNLPVPAATYPGTLAWGDFNGDGKLDFVLTCYNSSTNFALLYLNNLPGPIAPPAVPTSLSTTVHGNACTFAWTGPSQARGLTYNLRVGTAPGATDTVSPLANTATGARLLSRAGNVGSAQRYCLTNLPAGTYYWSVQAVSSAFNGSAFAPEQSFVRSAQPLANAQSLVLPEDTSRALTLTGADPDARALTFALVTQPSHGTLSGTPPALRYQPATNYFGADSFTFKANNGLIDSAHAQVTLVITQVPDVPGGASLSICQTNGQFTLSLVGEPYDSYRIEASQDLVHWVVLTNLLPTNGPLPFTDPDAALYSHRFYRPVLQFTPPQLSVPQVLPNQAFQFSFTADVGRYYQLLASTNLHDWVLLTTLPATSSNMLYLDPAAANYPQRFYRAVPTP